MSITQILKPSCENSYYNNTIKNSRAYLTAIHFAEKAQKTFIQFQKLWELQSLLYTHLRPALQVAPDDSDYATSTSQMKIQSSSQRHMESIGLIHQRNLPQYTNSCHGSRIMEAVAVVHSIHYTPTSQLQKKFYHSNSCKIVIEGGGWQKEMKK